MSAPSRLAPSLALGPVQYNWPVDDWRDFYFRIADEAPVDTVYVGETVCSKRTPFYAPVLPEVIERLTDAGKEVIISTLSLVMSGPERAELVETTGADFMVEANDMAAVALLEGRRHVIGPTINVYNEATLAVLARRGAQRVCLPAELAREAITALAADPPADLEVQVFGRLPLAISARCYHARAHGLSKDSCRYVCAEDRDGLALDTLDHEAFLTVNGVQTQSHSYCNLIGELADLQALGVTRFRLWPQDCDMVAVAALFRRVAEGALAADEALAQLEDITGGVAFSNGFYHGCEGVAAIGVA